MKESVAIIGTGIAGLGCAWNLRDVAQLTLFEQDARPGGHTNTVTINEGGRPLPMDTGFLVFNKVTYPNLCRLFKELEIRSKPAEMSFSVRHLGTGLEYNGMGINKVFAQRRNLFNLRFHKLLSSIQRFFKLANQLIAAAEPEGQTMREFVECHKLGRDFLDLYLVPMSSAVWSTDPVRVLEFPAATFIRFFHNHGFLGVDTHHQWLTVDGGAKTYVDKILAITGAPRLRSRVVRVMENSAKVQVVTENGDSQEFDRVILASHADQSLAMLSAPTEPQARLLDAFRYQKNHAILHTDARVMPQKRRAWASWNYRVDPKASSSFATTHYWLNALQGVSQNENYFVSLNSTDFVDPSKILYETTYEHPVYTLEAIRAQKDLPGLNATAQRTFFCGSYFKYGFHEDAYTSAVDVSASLRERLSP